MSKVINFDPANFKIDGHTGGDGSRMVITDHKGANHMAFELGSWGSRWSQIIGKETLEPQTDYSFRFAMTGGFDDLETSVSQFILFPWEDWEARVCYPLSKSRFAPVISKRSNDGGLLRVFDVQFNTGDSSEYGFVFVSKGTVADFFAPREDSYYDDLEDLDYVGMWNERIYAPNFCGIRPADYSRKRKSLGDKAEEKAVSIASTGNSSIANENLTAAQFAALLSGMCDGDNFTVSNVNVNYDGNTGFSFDDRCCDGCNVTVKNCHLTASAFVMLLNKLGDGCCVEMSNVKCEQELDCDPFIASNPDGVVLKLSNCDLDFVSGCALFSLPGDGGVLDLQNVTIGDGTIECYNLGTNSGDGIVAELHNCQVPDEILDIIRKGSGDGCVVSIS